MRSLEALLARWATKAHRRPMGALFLAVVLSVFAGIGANQLRLVADLENLLPKSFESVKTLEPLKKRFGGIGYLVVVGMGGDEASLKQFAEDYVPRLSRLPGIRYVDHKREGSFFSDRAMYFLELEDIEEISRRLKERERYERRQKNPLFVKLVEEEAPPLDFSDIEAKYGIRPDQRLSTGGEYYLDGQKKMVVLLAKPTTTANDLAFSAKLVEEVEGFFAREDLSKYGKDFRIGLTGTYKYKVDQQRQLANDMRRASTLALIVLLVYLLFHFRSLLAVGLVLVPVSVGLSWTYGLTALTFGSLNILTGFLGAILGGLGIEHGIHLLGRYEVLRSENHDSEEAVSQAFTQTGSAALVSSLVAALTFFAVAISEFRAFREFGIIAAMGMIVVLAAYVLILPAGLALASRWGWKPSTAHLVSKHRLARLVSRYARPLVVAVGLVLAFFIARLPSVRFDFDFNSLEDSTFESARLDKEVNRILGYNMEPVVILTDRADSERELVAALKKRQRAQGKNSTIDFVASLDELVPPAQAEKREVMDRILETVSKVKVESLDEETRPRFLTLQRWLQAQPFERADIPKAIRRQFEGTEASDGGFVLIFPNIKLSDGKQVRAFAREVRGIVLSNGDTFSAAGESLILADVLEMVIRESPPVLVAAVVSVMLAMWLTLGSFRVAVVCMSPTVLSLFGLIGLMAAMDMPFNYLNILIVPVLIGVTVDAGVHLVHRLAESPQESDFLAVYSEVARAIRGGLITSGVGFGAMLMADHPGLNSLGKLANLGFAMNMFVMLVGFPAAVLWLNRQRMKRTLTSEQVTQEQMAP